VVHVNRNHPQVSGRVVQGMLAAVALATVLGVGGCGDSQTAQSNKAVTEASNKAARQTASAGDFRPTEGLTRRVNGGEDPAKIADDIKSKVTGDRAPIEAQTAYKTFITQKPISDDLKEVANYLNTVRGADGSADAQFKGLILAQSGQVANEQAQLHLTSMENSLRDLSNLAVDIQTQAGTIATLGSQASLADQRSKLGPKDMPKTIEDAKTALEQAKKDAGDKTQAAAAVKADIDQKKAEAQRLYDQSAKDLQAADQAKGMGSIDAYNKAIAVRGQADQLAADATSLQPKLLAATDDARMAQAMVTDGEEAVRALSVAGDTFGNRSKGATEESKQYAAAAAKRVTDPESGLSKKLNDFKILAAKIDEEVDLAVKDATNAGKSFENARSELVNFRDEISKKRDTFKANDSLLKVGQDRKPEAMMYLCKASAEYRVGQAHLISMTAASLQDFVAQSVGPAFKAAAISTDAPAGAGDRLAKARDAAKTSFEAARKSLDNVVGDRPMFAFAEYEAPRWLGFTLKAVVCQGLAIASTDAGDQQKAKDDSAAAAKAAVDRNPGLQLPGLLGAQ